MPDYSLLIDGQLIETERSFPVVNPATEEVIAACPLAEEADLDVAVKAARKAQLLWAATPYAKRQETLVAIADVIKDHKEELAKLLVQEQGKPLFDALAEISGAEYYTRYYASLELPVRVVEDNERQRVEEHRKPLGVVAGIVPWNYPFMIAVYKLAPAILAGNAFILKPAPTTSLTALRFGALIQGVVPKGVVQILSDNNNLGPLITSHAEIAKISFTGSTATGKAIMRSGADTLKRLTLELGGNDAAIVLADVDLDVVAPRLYAFAFSNAGQVCVAIKRLYVHDDIYDDVCARLAALAEKVTVGDGMQDGVRMGPLQNKMQFEKVLSLIDAVKKGEGDILTGGERLGEKGYFIKPTIVSNVREGSPLVDEEAFGPVLPVIRYTDIEDVIERANTSSYGLGASVWSSDTQRATEIARRLDSGTVWVNQHMILGPNIPLRGAKQSGVGVENAVEGFYEYTSPQIINIAKV
ncbi:MAG: aldehyde dehydrogenase family protein [Pseudomonadota bacterium]